MCLPKKPIRKNPYLYQRYNRTSSRHNNSLITKELYVQYKRNQRDLLKMWWPKTKEKNARTDSQTYISWKNVVCSFSTLSPSLSLQMQLSVLSDYWCTFSELVEKEEQDLTSYPVYLHNSLPHSSSSTSSFFPH